MDSLRHVRAQFDAYTDNCGFELVKLMITAAAINKSRMVKYYARNRRSTDPEKADQIMTYAVQIDDYIKRMEELGSEIRSPLKTNIEEKLRIDTEELTKNSESKMSEIDFRFE